jgi:hypothetical protein
VDLLPISVNISREKGEGDGVEGGRVPASAGTDDGGFLTCWDDEGYVFEDGSIGMVTKRYILKLDVAPLKHKRFRVRCILNPISHFPPTTT